MRIVNNKIYISQGESPTYSAVYRDKNTGEPFKIPFGASDPYVRFIVRDSVYKTIGTPRINYKLDWDKIIVVSADGINASYRLDEEIQDYGGTAETTWDNNYFDNGHAGYGKSKTALYRKLNANDEYEYKYYRYNPANQTYSWEDYSFRMVFQLSHEHTKRLEAKTYSYEITLFYSIQNEENPAIDETIIDDSDTETETQSDTVLHKEIILPPTEFVVGGSLSE